MKEYVECYHQGKGSVIFFPFENYDPDLKSGEIKCEERLGGLLDYLIMITFTISWGESDEMYPIAPFFLET